MPQSTRTMKEPPMSMMQPAFGSWQVVVASMWSVWLPKRAFLAFKREKPVKICTCMGELDTAKFKFPQPHIWTCLRSGRLRLAESSHSLVIGHPPDLRPLPREMAIHEKSPSAKHISKLKEEIVSKWLCKNVRFLLSGSAIRDLNPSVLNK